MVTKRQAVDGPGTGLAPRTISDEEFARALAGSSVGKSDVPVRPMPSEVKARLLRRVRTRLEAEEIFDVPSTTRVMDVIEAPVVRREDSAAVVIGSPRPSARWTVREAPATAFREALRAAVESRGMEMVEIARRLAEVETWTSESTLASWISGGALPPPDGRLLAMERVLSLPSGRLLDVLDRGSGSSDMRRTVVMRQTIFACHWSDVLSYGWGATAASRAPALMGWHESGRPDAVALYLRRARASSIFRDETLQHRAMADSGGSTAVRLVTANAVMTALSGERYQVSRHYNPWGDRPSAVYRPGPPARDDRRDLLRRSPDGDLWSPRCPDLGGWDYAEDELRRLRESYRRTHGPASALVLAASVEHVCALVFQGKRREGEEELSELLPRLLERFGPDDPLSLRAQFLSGLIDAQLQRYDRARVVFVEVLRGQRVAIGATHAHTLRTQYELAVALKLTGDPDWLPLMQAVRGSASGVGGQRNGNDLATQAALALSLLRLPTPAVRAIAWIGRPRR